MTVVVAYCEHCGSMFRSKFSPGPGAMVGRLTLKGNREQCRNCGQMANVVDGVFTAAFGTVQLIDAPQLTRDILARFTELVAKARNQEITADELEQEATKLDPKLGQAVSQARASGSKFWTTTLLLASLTASSCKLDAKIDLNRAFDQAVTAIERLHPHPVPPPAKRDQFEE